MILSWCFDVLTKILISHLLTCHRLPITPRQPPTPSGCHIPSNTSSTRGRRNIKVRNRRQVYLPDTFDYSPLTHHFTSSHPAASFYMPHGHKIYLLTHRSPRTHHRRRVNEIWRCYVDEKEQVSEVRARVVFFLYFQHLTSACWLLLLWEQTTRNNQPPEKPNDENTNTHTTINPRMILCPRQEELGTGKLFHLYLLVNSNWMTNSLSYLLSLSSSNEGSEIVSYE
jgi:hypothetical protein